MLHLTSFFTLAIATLASASPILQSRAELEVIPNQYIVTFKSDANLAPRNVTLLVDQIIAEISQGNIARRDGFAAPQILQRYDFGQGSYQGFAIDVQPDAVEQLKQHPEVEDVAANYVHTLEPIEVVSEAPYEGLTKRAWPAGLWGLDAIDGNADGQFVYPVKAGENVDVYVIDTGVDAGHPEFERRALLGPSYTGPRIAATHGTHVAGTIAGRSFGIAKRATIISVQVFGPSGSGTTDKIVAAVNWSAQAARQRGRQAVANLSLGGGRDPSMDRALQALINTGVAVSVAAGNSRGNACNESPASLRDAVTVGASGVNYQFASRFSNFGPCVDLIAPGAEILSALPNGRQGVLSGTSMAAPHVAGVLAVERSLRPSSDVRGIQNRVIARSQRGRIRNLPAQTPNLFLNLSA
ncbi:peptidase S8/S53 domain-containing protein [Phlyctochytrium arcticum]|nr:peptidase S8/S53 domain-containing protein [Phlyctochytrium arcticum]